MARHVENTRKIVAFLDGHGAVSWVGWPELESHPDRDLARRLLPKGCGAVFSFEIGGGREAGRVFIERLGLFSHLANVGDAKSLVIHPASTTHQQMDAAALKAARDRRRARPALGRAGGSRRPDRRSRPGIEGGGASRDPARGGVAAWSSRSTGARPSRRRAAGPSIPPGPRFCSSTARPTIIRSGTCRRRYFAHHGYSAAAIDLPGHGRSGGEPLTGIDEMAGWLGRARAALGLDRAVLAGHSMGSLIALCAAADNPGATERLILLGAGRRDAGARRPARRRAAQRSQGDRPDHLLGPERGVADRRPPEPGALDERRRPAPAGTRGTTAFWRPASRPARRFPTGKRAPARWRRRRS